MKLRVRAWLWQVKGGGFGRNEEWEVDWKAPDRTFLMCCSANWGNGGYLMVDDKGELRRVDPINVVIRVSRHATDVLSVRAA
jgi:hypothetical protein